jgi:hypothetical protein
MKMNKLQAKRIWNRFMEQRETRDAAELVISQRLPQAVMPTPPEIVRFLTAWALALADGDVDPMLEEMVEDAPEDVAGRGSLRRGDMV